jgi:hypothetical protein
MIIDDRQLFNDMSQLSRMHYLPKWVFFSTFHETNGSELLGFTIFTCFGTVAHLDWNEKSI